MVLKGSWSTIHINNKVLYKVQNLVHRYYSKRTHGHTHMHAHTHVYIWGDQRTLTVEP